MKKTIQEYITRIDVNVLFDNQYPLMSLQIAVELADERMKSKAYCHRKKNKTKLRKQNYSWQKLKRKAVLWKYGEDKKKQWLSLVVVILLFSWGFFIIHY